MDIALTGIGCRFPKSSSGPEEFWRALLAGSDAVGPIPEDRWSRDAFYDPDPLKPTRILTDRGAFLDQSISAFDADFFNITPLEAAQMDPQQRLLLEVSFEALEDADLDVNALRGSSTGVFIGAFTLDNMVQRNEPAAREDIGGLTAMSCTHTVLASRISYTFDLRGPCMTIDTACSSSLVAVHQACLALRSGECDRALVGGVNRILRPETAIMMSKGGFLAPDGRSKSFSVSADGYGRGEGCGIVMLRPLDEALAAGDRIYAVLEGSGVNQDGRTLGMAMPSEAAQSQLIEAVSVRAQIDPADIDYVEAHGTGTAAGDPVELAAIGATFGRAPGRTVPCLVGSVKAGIGHTEGSAGIAGLIKAALVVHHRRVPPQAWLDELNPRIDFDGLGLAIATGPTELPSGRTVRAAVNSFGYGGTNAHVLLRSGPSPTGSPRPVGGDSDTLRRPSPEAVFVSARSEDALREMAGQYAGLLVDVQGQEGRRADLLAAFGRRTAHPLRMVVRGPSDRLEQVLRTVADGDQHPDALRGRSSGQQDNAPVFVFSGMGPQWWGMGRELLEESRLFRTHAERCDDLFRQTAGWSVLDEMLAPEHSSRLTQTEVAQPATFVLQTGLVEVLRELGVRPGALIGHSVGEVAAAYVAGRLSLEDALTVAHHRSRLQATLAGEGGMLATALGIDEAQRLVLKYPEAAVAVAADNSPTNTALAGLEIALDEIEASLSTSKVFARRLNVAIPYHSPFMDPLLDELRRELKGISPRSTVVPTFSTVGVEHDVGPWDADYWALNVRHVVEFREAVLRSLAEGHRVFVELGAHPVLAMYLREITTGIPGAEVITSLRRDGDDLDRLLDLTARLWTFGVPVSWPFSGGRSHGGRLPSYPWQRSEHWQESAPVAAARTGDTGEALRLLGGAVDEPKDEWTVDLAQTAMPWLRQHVVDGAPVVPAAAFLEVLAAHGQRQGGDGTACVEDFVIHTPLVLAPHADSVLRVRSDPADEGVISVSARRLGGDRVWRRCVSGRVGVARHAPRARLQPVDGGEVVDSEALYAAFEALGIVYHGPFRAVRTLRRDGGLVTAEVSVPIPPDDRYLAYPPALDAALQVLLGASALENAALHLPVRVDRLVIHAPIPERFTVNARVGREDGTRAVVADIELVGPSGELLGALTGVTLGEVPRSDEAVSYLDSITYESQWRRQEPELSAGGVKRLAVLGGGNGSLVSALRDRGADVVEVDAEALVDDPGTRADTVVIEVAADDLASTRSKVVEVLGVVRHLAGRFEGVVDLVFVTADAVGAAPADRVEGWMAAWVIGLRRVIANEVANIHARFVDHDGSSTDQVAEFILGGKRASEVAIRRGEQWTLEANRLGEREARRTFWAHAPTVAAAEVANFSLRSTGRGPNGTTWVTGRRREPGPGEVEVRVQAVGLNYKDLLKQAGVFTAAMAAKTFTGPGLGMEQCIVVERVGPGVTRLEVGQRYLATIPGGFSRYLTLREESGRFAPVPQGWSDVEAAGQLVVLSTAHAALVERARVQAGEIVLVHGGAGALGCALTAVALAQGARVLATASNERRREFALAAGAERCFDSRSGDFVDEVLEATGGRGADVVINTLPGIEGLLANLRVAAEGGRVVELGKGTVVAGSRLPLDYLDRNLSISVFDLDHLVRDPAKFDDLAEAVLSRVHSGDYHAVPVVVVDPPEIGAALRSVAESSHVGKQVVDMSRTGELACVADLNEMVVIDEAASYVISGGTGGLGLETAAWLTTRGARRIALLSRRGSVTPEADASISNLRGRGVEVTIASVDVTDGEALRVFLSSWRRPDLPIKGVIHAAGVAHDLPLERVQVEDWWKVFAPKVVGAMNLHALTLKDPIDFFVGFSSVSAWTGTSGQGAYAASNSTLESFIDWRRRSEPSRNSAAVALGPFAEVGMAAVVDEVADYVRLLGFEPLLPADLGAMLDRAIRWRRGALGLFDLDWVRWSIAEPRAAAEPRFATLVAEARTSRGKDPAAVRTVLALLSPADRSATIGRILVAETAAITGHALEDIDLDCSLIDFNLDSLMMVELQTCLNEALGAELSVMELLSRGSLREVVAEVERSVLGGAVA